MQTTIPALCVAVMLVAPGNHAAVQLQFQALVSPPMPRGTGTISGVVVTGGGLPANGALVTLTWREDTAARTSARPTYAPRTTTADGEGRFNFADVAQHGVELMASLEGMIDARFGQIRPGLDGRPIRLSAGERLDVRLQLRRGATISGTVVDADGMPAPGIEVNAFRLRPLHGGEELMGPDWGHASTGQDGAYRIENLPPGRYILSCYRATADLAPPPPRRLATGDLAIESATYFPNALDADAAERLDLTAGAGMTGVNLRLRLRPVTTISGVVRDGNGQPARGAGVQLSSAMGPATHVTVGSDGTFEIARVEAGQYELSAYSLSRPTEWARARVSTDGRTLQRVELTLAPAASVRGRVVAAGAPRGRATTPFTLFFAAAHGNGHYDVPGVARVVAMPAFAYLGVPPGRYVIVVNQESLPDGWQMHSEMVDGRDALDFPFEIRGTEDREVVITITDQRTSLGGSILDDRGQPSVDHTVVVFAGDDRFWTPRTRRVLTDRPDQHGRYRVTGLPEGGYIVALAAPDLYGDPQVPLLRELRAVGARIAIRAGTRTTHDLRVGRVGR